MWTNVWTWTKLLHPHPLGYGPVYNDSYITRKVVIARNQTTINLTAVQPIRHGDTSKEAPAEQRESVATTFFRPASFLSDTFECFRYEMR